ncbi:pyridoxamine 5'-phosphate oxidase family protein [Marinitoga aeolica]|uniref:Pyridoxamine 5'-phosphate oxidase family protein n=1 Tax=Marinitoga aeolica TaxID=2809031 RepID=A0ABY8PPM0_9BACT|nr:pyridoxamine 5'-phosphate oxidase family protein [Marinitoga aeolica]WGS64596.1 pyridoxamine 5'-phosphate oxidase family protein [Marinitoga aeolica]
MLKEKVRKVVESHNLMHIATVDLNGFPKARGVDYVMGENENELYFITHKMTNKVNEIKNNPNVSVVIDHDCPSFEDLLKLVYIKGTGKAEVIEDPEGVMKVFGMILQKFPYLKNLPGEPTDFVGIKVTLKEVYVTDNTVSFGHTEKVEY